MITNALHRLGQFIIAVTLVGGLLFACVQAQDKRVPGAKGGLGQPAKGRGTIPLVRVKARPAMGELPGFAGRSGRRSLARPTSPPAALSSDLRMRLLRESGIDFTPPNAPHEFRLSPRQPYVSSSAYLFFSGEVEFNASGDSLLLSIEETVPIPAPSIPGLGESGWASGGPQPDPPGIVGVLVRMEPRSRYLADFSVSANAVTNYHLTVTGAEGSGNFAREAGGQHVLVALDSPEGGYVRINFSSGRSFTFHSVVITKLD
jgi:hypothetical protein